MSQRPKTNILYLSRFRTLLCLGMFTVLFLPSSVALRNAHATCLVWRNYRGRVPIGEFSSQNKPENQNLIRIRFAELIT
jgi:hypothetical protein